MTATMYILVYIDIHFLYKKIDCKNIQCQIYVKIRNKKLNNARSQRPV